MREVIADQLGKDIVSTGSHFKIGYFKGNKRVWLQNATNTKEVQRLLQSGSQTVTFLQRPVYKVNWELTLEVFTGSFYFQ